MRKGSVHPEQAVDREVQRRIHDPVLRIYWFIGAATLAFLIVWAIFIVVALGKYGDSHRNQQNAATAQPEDTAQQHSCAVTFGGRGFYCIQPGPPSAGDQNKTEAYDLKAQQEMSKWALGVLLISVAGIVVSVLGIVVVGGTLHETRQMTIATREIGREQSRARLVIQMVHFEFYEQLPDCIGVTISFRNTGPTPAYNFGCEVIAKWVGGDIIPIREQGIPRLDIESQEKPEITFVQKDADQEFCDFARERLMSRGEQISLRINFTFASLQKTEVRSVDYVVEGGWDGNGYFHKTAKAVSIFRSMRMVPIEKQDEA